MSETPLWMPTGSVRALLAFLSVGALVAAVFIDVSPEGIAVLAGLAGSAITYYFTKRDAA